jgi:N-acetylneuraminic acid mutarotase
MSIPATLRRTIPSRRGRPRRKEQVALAALVLLVPALTAASTPSHPVPALGEWRARAPLPVPRTEVAATAAGNEIVVVGGFLPNRSPSSRADAYSPASNRWRRLPNLPVSAHHPMAAGAGDRVYVIGGYHSHGVPLRTAYVLEDDRWRALPRPPERRAAAAAAIVGTKLYVVGGVGPNGLARRALVLDLVTNRWTTTTGPTPREHLAAVAVAGRVYAIAGRKAGYDTNLALVESYAPATGTWRREPPVPGKRGGTGAAALGAFVISVGGEEPAGTIASVYMLDTITRQWSRLPDLPTPRHGLGVVRLRNAIHAIAGGPEPGLTVSGANESLTAGG